MYEENIKYLTVFDKIIVQQSYIPKLPLLNKCKKKKNKGEINQEKIS